MSQSYVIRVAASVKENVKAKDRRVKSLVLSEILPTDELREVLRQRLEERGWRPEEGNDGVYVRQRGDVTEKIDLESLTCEAEVEVERTLERQRSIMVRGDRDFENEEDRRRKEQERLERSIAITDAERQEASDALQRRIADLLDETDEERTAELNSIVREVYTEALKRKAARLGSITEVREGQTGDDYELVIKVAE